MTIYQFYLSAFRFSFHLLLNRKTALKLVLKSSNEIDFNFVKKALLSNFDESDLKKFYRLIYNNSYLYNSFDDCGEKHNIDSGVPKKMNVLFNFTNSQRASIYLYDNYNLNFITNVLNKTLPEIKNEILIISRIFEEVYI